MNKVTLFRGASLKINRAQEHIREIESLIKSWRDLDPYKVSIDNEQETGEKILRIIITKTMPKDISLVIGDAIHNLRTALDHAAFEIVQQSKGSRKALDSTYFPFEGDRESLKSSRKFGTIASVSQKAANIILDTIKPYKGGNNILWALNRIDVLDKHRLLIPHADALSVIIDAVKDGKGIFWRERLETQGRIRGRTTWLSSDLDIKGYREPEIELFFGEGSFLDGKPVVETLIMISVEVSRALAQLESIDP
jgi:hypothetical protein